jgi:hypothetical protein
MKHTQRPGLLIGLFVIIGLLLLIPLPTQGINEITIPDGLTAASDGNVSTSIMLENSTGVASVGIKLSYNASVVNATGATMGDFTAFFGFDDSNAANGWITINTYIMGQDLTGDVKVADVTLEAVGNSGDASPLQIEILSLANQYGSDVIGRTNNGTFTVTPLVFDTGLPANPYPCIAGIHNGTLTPNQTINVHKLYTYPCKGTGGHSEYVKLRDNTGWNVTASWNGYSGDWRNLTFNESFTLYAGTTYNYTIRTGSYPQIIHERAFNATGGVMTCTSFEDANGNVHINWIPAFRLE